MELERILKNLEYELYIEIVEKLMKRFGEMTDEFTTPDINKRCITTIKTRRIKNKINIFIKKLQNIPKKVQSVQKGLILSADLIYLLHPLSNIYYYDVEVDRYGRKEITFFPNKSVVC